RPVDDATVEVELAVERREVDGTREVGAPARRRPSRRGPSRERRGGTGVPGRRSRRLARPLPRPDGGGRPAAPPAPRPRRPPRPTSHAGRTITAAVASAATASKNRVARRFTRIGYPSGPSSERHAVGSGESRAEKRGQVAAGSGAPTGTAGTRRAEKSSGSP